MRRPRILLDVDGPLTRGFFVLTCKLLRERGIQNAWPTKLSDWDIMKSFDVPHDIEEEVRRLLRRPGVASSFAARLGAFDFLRSLREWADVYACTSPLDGSPTWAHEREEWLIETLDFKRHEIVSCRDKRVVAGNAFVDDKLAHLVEWSDEWKSGIPVMWTDGYNTNEPWTQMRASTYDELSGRLSVLRRAA